MDLLPKEIIPTVLCYTLCTGHEEEILDSHGKAEIAICNANGYLLELSNKKIVNSCYILIEDASKLQLYCNFIRGRCMVYYLVTNENGVMVVVKKLNQFLMVVGCYNNVRDCKVFDFENKGRPQLGVYHFDNDIVQIMDFSEFDNYKPDMTNPFPEHQIQKCPEMKTRNVSQTEEDHVNELSDDEMQSSNWNHNMFNFFSKKLQAVEQYNNELNYEIYKMDSILKNGIKNANQISGNASYCKHIKFTNSWSRIHLGQWILGVEFWSSDVRDVNDIRIVPTGRDFTFYTYRFFTLSNEGDSNARKRTGEDEVMGNVAEKDQETTDHSAKWECVAVRDRKVEGRTTFRNRTKSIAVVCFRVPEFGQRSHLSVSLTFICETRQFHTETFHLRTEHFFQENYQIFRRRNEVSLSEDLMACLAVREETSFIVEMRYNLGISLEDVLTEKLGFSKARILGDNYFVMESGDLCGTSIFVKRVGNDLVSWHLRISATNATILRILIGGIYNELPLPVAIRLQP